MKKHNILFLLLTGIISFSLFFSFNSCRKPDNPRAVITVLDTAGYTVEGAYVKIWIEKYNGGYINPKDSTLEYTEYTNASGQVIYESEVEGIRDVHVTMAPDSVTYFEERTGDGVIILKYDATDQEEVIIR